MVKTALLIVSGALTAFAQGGSNPLSANMNAMYGTVKNNITKAADKMPEENYAYKPTDEVRSFGQLVGHVSDANYMFCSAVLGEKPPVSGIEKGKSTKADLTAALKESFAYCDKAYSGMTDTAATETVKFFGQDRPKLGILSFNNMHDYEHYGNMVTYMRLKKIVPPSSEGRR